MKRKAVFLLAGIIMFSCVFSVNGANFSGLLLKPVLPHYRSWDHVGYQARVTLSDGNTISDGVHVFIFTLHDHETASNPVWSETRTESTTDGLLSLKLGEVVPLVLDDFGSSSQDTSRVLYLEVNVDGETITPRTEIIATPYSLVSARLMGDVQTSDGSLLILEQTSGDTAVAMGSDPSKALNAYLKLKGETQSNISMEADASKSSMSLTHDSSFGKKEALRVLDETQILIRNALLDNAGDTLASFGRFTTSAGSRARMTGRNPVTGEETQVTVAALTTLGGNLKIANIGSSGEDGVFIDVTPPSPTPTSSKLFVGGLSFIDNGAELSSSIDSTKLEMYQDGSGGSGGRIVVRTTDLHGHLTVQNIGSSGLDGVSIESNDSTSVIGIEHEDIGVRIHTSNEGAGAGMTLLDGTGDSTIYAMNKADLVETVASETHTTSLSPEGLIVSNIGSSGVDGIVIQGGDGLGGKIALKKLKSGETIQTEIISLTLEGSSPISIKAPDAAPLDPSLFELEYDSFGRVVERFDGTPTSPGDSSEFNSSGLRLYDGLDRVILENDNGGKMSLQRLQSGETIPTEIISLSLQGANPPISIRMPDALPLDIPLATYEYDMLSRRVVKVFRSEAGQVGDSSHQSSTGLHLFDSSNELKFDINGIGFSNVTGNPFSVTPNGDILSRGTSELALDAGTSVGIGGTFPGVKLFVDGDVCHTGILGPCSDRRFKKNILPINNSLKKVLKLQGVTFDWDIESHPQMKFNNRKQIGFIAQDVNKIIPEIVSHGEDGYYFVDYSKVTPILIEALKEQQTEIDQLKNEMKELKALLTNIVNQTPKNGNITLSSR